MSDVAPRLTIDERETVDARGATAFVLRGEIDAHSAELLQARFDPLPPGGDVELDMHDVAFMDSSGLRVLVDVHRRAEQSGRRLCICNPARAVRRVIEISGLADHLHLVDAD